jgi:iron complex transport system substrate-binding protein
MVKIYNELLDEYLEIPRPVKKIISLDPASTETIFFLGYGEKIVGTDAFSYRPEEAKKIPKIGSYTHVKMEFLESQKPDIIFTTMGAQKELTKLLLNKGYNVYPISVATSVSKILNNIIIIGEVLGIYEKSRELYLNLLEIITENLSSPKVNVYIEFDLGGPITAGFPTHVSDAIRIAGGKNIFDEFESAYFEPNPSDIIKGNPSIIIYEPKRFSDYEKERFLRSLKNRGLESLISKKIFYTKGDFLAHQGPSFILDCIPWLKAIFSS